MPKFAPEQKLIKLHEEFNIFSFIMKMTKNTAQYVSKQ